MPRVKGSVKGHLFKLSWLTSGSRLDYEQIVSCRIICQMLRQKSCSLTSRIKHPLLSQSRLVLFSHRGLVWPSAVASAQLVVVLDTPYSQGLSLQVMSPSSLSPGLCKLCLLTIAASVLTLSVMTVIHR
jgi:hypothetical protein